MVHHGVLAWGLCVAVHRAEYWNVGTSSLLNSEWFGVQPFEGMIAWM